MPRYGYNKGIYIYPASYAIPDTSKERGDLGDT